VRPKDAAKAAAPQRRVQGEPWPPTAGRLGRSFPRLLAPVLAVHGRGRKALARRRCALERFDPDDDQAFVFTSPMGTPLRHSNFYRRAWLPAVARAGLSGIHFHDLRHAGNTLTADAGASLRELMDRMGHSSTRAALIYQHSSDERQRKFADAVGEAAGQHLARRHPHLARTWHMRPAVNRERLRPTGLYGS
jgi:integrase